MRQIEAKAVRKLQNPVRSSQLEGFVPEDFGAELRKEKEEQAAKPLAGQSQTGVVPESNQSLGADLDADEIPFWQVSKNEIENENLVEKKDETFSLFQDSFI